MILSVPSYNTINSRELQRQRRLLTFSWCTDSHGWALHEFEEIPNSVSGNRRISSSGMFSARNWLKDWQRNLAVQMIVSRLQTQCMHSSTIKAFLCFLCVTRDFRKLQPSDSEVCYCCKDEGFVEGVEARLSTKIRPVECADDFCSYLGSMLA